MAVTSINQTLDALAALVQSAVQICTVHAPEKTLGPLAIYPVIQIYPWRLHLERNALGMWGNLMWDHPHAHGPDLYRCAVLALPLTPDSDQDTARLSVQNHVDSIRAALMANPTLADGQGTAQVLDAADHMQTDYDGEGAVIEWHRRSYMGAYVTVAVQPLWRSPSPSV